MSETSAHSYKIGFVEDDPGFSKMLKEQLEAMPQVARVSAWSSAEQFRRYRNKKSLDLLILDVNLPGWNGVRLLADVNSGFPDLPIMMLTTLSDDETIFDCLKAGAVGYWLKSDLERLPGGLVDVLDGGSAISPEIAVKVLGYFRKSKLGEVDVSLTEQEKKILKMVTKGIKQTDVARELDLSINTVKFHVRNIYKKLNVKNRAALTDLAYKKGLI